MKRFSIVARVGSTDTSEIELLDKSSKMVELSFIRNSTQWKYGLNEAFHSLSKIGLIPHTDAVDLLVLASIVYAVDTKIERITHSQDGWSREIDLYLPVGNPDLWDKARDNILEPMLRFLTGDIWRIRFRRHIEDILKFIPCNQEKTLNKIDAVCLFSGGLDSFIGALDLFQNGTKPLLISHYSNYIDSKIQKACFDILRNEYNNDTDIHIKSKIGFKKNTITEGEKEDSLRSRSMLFISLGVLAASTVSDKMTLFIPENGLISLNVPIDPLRIGANSTRTTHPFFIDKFQKLLDHLGLEVKLENRYRFKTKGEMLQGCMNQEIVKKHASITMSCAHPSNSRYSPNQSPYQHCGRCFPCIIRRAAFKHAEIEDLTNYVLEDLWSRILDSKKAEGKDIHSLKRHIEEIEGNPNLAKYNVYRSGPLFEIEDDIIEYIDIYRRGIIELSDFVEGIETKSSELK
ncbi:MAG: 7-cyano-7-deazaguanine synthase [Deltaproteobacteria bacterium]|nr:7-cyano-7-deazaguanine synthase [Candidatus Zymogenaceae bacterium]